MAKARHKQRHKRAKTDSQTADLNFLLDGKKIDPKRAEKRNAKIFCGGLKPDTTDEAIKGVFSQYGEIELFER